MKISSINNSYNQNFRGTFFYSTDEHSKSRDIARGLTTVENFTSSRLDKKLPVFYLNGGDFITTAKDDNETSEIYHTFAKTNPEITPVFALGNLEAILLRKNISRFKSSIETIAKNLKNMNFLFTPRKALEVNMEEGEHIPDYVKPYTILKDRVKTSSGDYKIQNVAVIATGCDENLGIDDQKEELAQAIEKLALEDEAIDKVFLISHNNLNHDFNIFAHSKLKGAGLPLNLVLMGHSHSVYEETIPGTDIKVISPPPNGLGFVQIETTENGVMVPDMPKMPIAIDGKPDPYNYHQETCLQNGEPAMFTLNGKVVLDKAAAKYYIRGLDTYVELEPNQRPKLRITNRKAPSTTTELGTAMANGIHDITKSDFAVAYGLHIRTPLIPTEGNRITMYDVKNVFQDNFTLALVEFSAEELVELFEKALAMQDSGSLNNRFLEYSDNVEVTRDPSKKYGESGLIKQIKIKKGNETIELFDKSGHLKDKDMKFVVGTCSYMPSPESNKIKLDDGFKILKEIKDSKFSDALMLELRKISNGEKSVSCSKMIDD